MSSVKRLVYAVIHFLREQSQIDTFTPDEQESLEGNQPGLVAVYSIDFSFLGAVLPLLQSLVCDKLTDMQIPKLFCSCFYCFLTKLSLFPSTFPPRAAAQSKLNKYSEAIKDCERAIAIDPKYSKAYGRMGLALTSVNKFEEAITSYQKALDLDPENDSYKSNLKIAEQKLRDMSSPTGTGLSFDMASLINNPAFISMAASLMQNPQVQQLMSGMMSNAIGGPAAGVGGLSDLSSLIHAGQQFAQQIQQQNPELIEQLRNHVRSRSFSGSTEEHS
uniref:Small glutamine rich tetratricopeptide repeat co-chaperone beta n=1 Tax=Anas platyrhynchos platyrhynchos TaxID=8840 RepID=A0A493STT4_ANAPP